MAIQVGVRRAWRLASAGLVVAAVVASVACSSGAGTDGGPAKATATSAAATAGAAKKPAADVIVPVVKSEDEWRKVLTPDQFNVLREAGTEVAFTGRYWNNHARGTYVCAACDLPLFSSATKYDSGTGWPSFWKPIAPNHVTLAKDLSFGEERDEVKCARCGGHLGHVFDDGPAPTGLRYCMNSAALKFIPAR
jgi:peptide-methionine (R)-S-oxide reductase